MCVRFKISERWRERLGILAGILNVLLALFGIALVFFSIYMKVYIETKMLLLEGYNSGTVPYFLVCLGSFMLIIHLFGAKIAFDCSSLENREKFRNILMCFFGSLCTLCIVVMAGGCVCFAHRSVIKSALEKGLYTALSVYKSKQYVKEALDRLQMDFRCCGSKAYEDWFQVSWIDNIYLDLERDDVKSRLRDGEYYSDSVPFSCCSVTSPRPCIHHNVSSTDSHNRYSDVTLYKEGCTVILGEYFSETILVPAGNTVFVVFGVEILTAVLFRHLQTSIVSAEEEGDPEGVGEGYCLSCGGEDPNKYLRKSDRDAEREELEENDEWPDAEGWDGGGGGGGGGDFGDGGGGRGGSGDDTHPHGRQKSGKKQGKPSGKDKEKKKKKTGKKEKTSPKSKKKPSPKSKKKTSPKSKQSSPRKKKTSPRAGKTKSSPKSKGGFGGRGKKRK